MFTSQNFVSIFYVSIMLGLNLIIGNILVDKIFSGFIRNVASCFEPIITILIYNGFSIEVVTGGITCLGLAFLVPGMMLIVGGQNYLEHQEIKINFLLYKEEEKNLLEYMHRSYISKKQNIEEESSNIDGEESKSDEQPTNQDAKLK